MKPLHNFKKKNPPANNSSPQKPISPFSHSPLPWGNLIVHTRATFRNCFGWPMLSFQQVGDTMSDVFIPYKN